jgi:spermidine synthase
LLHQLYSRAIVDRRLLIAAVAYANLVSLAAQVIWVRKINVLFGATAGVFASVLAVVLAGLAFGAAWGGNRSSTEARPGRLLGFLLIALGLLCAASLPLLDVARTLFLAIAPEGLAPAARAAIRIPVVALVILPATFAIGAILPLATKLYGRLSSGAVASVYAADTFGAAGGALIGGFLLVPHLGLRIATWVLGAGAIVLATLVLRSELPVEAEEEPEQAQPQKKGRGSKAKPEAGYAELTRFRKVAVLVSFFATGGAALLLETGWNRFFYLLNGTSIFSLSTVLAGFLTGIGLGSALVRRRLERDGDVAALVARLQIAVAIGGVLVFRSREMFERMYLSLYQATDNHLLFQAGVYLMVFGLVALATLAMGANFPAVVRLLTVMRDQEARTLGRVYFVNTAGAVAGALAGEFLILPRFGFDGLLATIVAIYLASAVLFWRIAAPRARRRSAFVLAVGAVIAVAITPPLKSYEPPWNAVYYSGVRQGSYDKYAALNAAHTVMFRKQGFYGQVTVTKTQSDYYLKHNGKTDASTNSTDSYAQYLLGHLPLMIHPNPERVVNIGLGGGLTLAAVAAHPQAKEIYQVELDPLVVEATGEWFAAANRNALKDPRVHLVVNDGRNFIEHGDRQFDVIISEPPNIWVSGVSGLFTTEFYRAAKRRLRPGGILCQWLPLYELTQRDFATALATLNSEFPHLSGWTNGSVAVILASADPLPKEMASSFVPPDVARDFQNAGIGRWSIPGFVGRPDLDDSKIKVFRELTTDINRDDLPMLEFHSARNLYYLTKPNADRAWRDGISVHR